MVKYAKLQLTDEGSNVLFKAKGEANRVLADGMFFLTQKEDRSSFKKIIRYLDKDLTALGDWIIDDFKELDNLLRRKK